MAPGSSKPHWLSVTRRSRIWSTHFGPYRQESFSSWIMRLAANYRLRPIDLIIQAAGRTIPMPADWDRFRDRATLEALALKTAQSPERLTRSTLARFEGALFEHMTPGAKLPLVRHASSGYQVCPRCLARLRNPHYRLIWRLQFVSVCTDHCDVLLDRCPACAAVIQPKLPKPDGSAWQVDRTGLCLCAWCDLDFRTVKTAGLPYGVMREAMRNQTKLLEVLALGPGFLTACQSGNRREYFTLLRGGLKGRTATVLKLEHATEQTLQRLPAYERALSVAALKEVSS